MPFRDIGVILNKTFQENEEEEIKQRDSANENQEQKQQYISLSTQAYKLFSEGRISLGSSYCIKPTRVEAIKFYRVSEGRTTTQSECGL
jgi:hypothetical protein